MQPSLLQVIALKVYSKQMLDEHLCAPMHLCIFRFALLNGSLKACNPPMPTQNDPIMAGVCEAPL